MGAKENCFILNHEKTTLPIQDIFWGNFYIWGHSFSIGQISVRKILIGQFLFLGGFFQLGEFCEWEILNLFFGVKFFI